ncbi:UNVERIFIED_CONTAM: hypothetical protein FKN15_047911 [Acipenser sinensis]
MGFIKLLVVNVKETALGISLHKAGWRERSECKRVSKHILHSYRTAALPITPHPSQLSSIYPTSVQAD